ncbi:NAD(P)-dependent alcohol dehydrogenase [Microcella humidisoli]|uniref:NAD(P)-dependent alcohol dehydrogenase n=1 Tax=Microcella humidisoli TaxID=2963406 RepID=A0ABY5FXD5_9MICO|nr:NAD(P)-dependent alcohol dehydrogenase [Microcella humidisoli]UTT62797.1 NAD(P)-dependent alcohol dehydrogenase [Microcella humidisoli]
MKSIVATTYGGPEVLRAVDAPPPVAAEGQVLVRVAASSVNPLDWHELRGMPYLVRIARGLRAPKPRGQAMGSDVAGVVESVGPGVPRFTVGDRVLGFGLGAWSELMVVGEAGLVHVPDGLPLTDAGGVGVAAITALQGLRRGGLVAPLTWAPGEVEPMRPRVLIIGASGGVGTFAVQIAKLLGAHVTAVTSTRNLELVARLGADDVIDYTTTEVTQGLPRFDLVFELAGNRRGRDLARILTPTGALVSCGAPRGQWVGPLVGPAVLAVRSWFSRRTFTSFLAKRDTADLQQLADWLGTGALRVVVDEVYPVERIADAVAHAEAGHARGKVVVTL